MASILYDHHVSMAFGILGNMISFFVYLAPLPTFYRIYKKKSTEGFQSIPYSVALFSAMLTLYYGFVKTNGLMIITINSIGCVIESIYLFTFMIYATKSARVFTTKLLLLFNVGAYGLILITTSLLTQGSLRRNIVGWICAVFSVCVFAAPLAIIRLVIRTKSVEFMPFTLSFSLTLCAVCWLLYGLSERDYYIATPNILGLAFGLTQMVLHACYKNKKHNEIMPVTQSQDLTVAANNTIELGEKDGGPENTNNENLNIEAPQGQGQGQGQGMNGEVVPSEINV